MTDDEVGVIGERSVYVFDQLEVCFINDVTFFHLGNVSLVAWRVSIESYSVKLHS